MIWNKKVFKNNAPFRSCISEINNTLIDNAEDLDIVMLEYIRNYSMTSGSVWKCYRDGIDGVDGNASQSKSFEYKTKITGKTPERPPRAPQPPPIQMDFNHHNHHNKECQL